MAKKKQKKKPKTEEEIQREAYIKWVIKYRPTF